MANPTKMIPIDVLERFLRQFAQNKLLVVSMSGVHAYGYPNPQSPLELKGIHVEPTENLVGLKHPPKTNNWVGEFEGNRIDYSSCELGQGFTQLLKGDGSILERVLAKRQLLTSEDLRKLQKIVRGVICRRFFHHYRTFSKGVLRDYEDDEQRTVRHLLGAYRLALTGVHLLKTGKVSVDLMALARKYGFSQIEELMKIYRECDNAVLKENNPFINRLVKLHALLERSMTDSQLPIDPLRPEAVEEYLLDMRRRFFDAATIQG